MPVRPILAQIILRSSSGLPTDVYVNDLVVADSTGMTDAAIASGVATAMAAFYNTARSTTKRVSQRLSEALSLNVDVRCFDLTGHLNGTPHGSPIAVDSFVRWGSDGLTPLPEEVAIALSYHADLTGIPETAANPTPPPAVIRPAARRRGRLFLGPFGYGVLAGPISGHCFITLDVQTEIVEAASQLAADLLAADLQWHVWSRKNADIYPVVGGFLDNAFDTIRSRGAEPNGRTFWT